MPSPKSARARALAPRFLAGAALVACHAAPSDVHSPAPHATGPKTSWVVIAPHPDDETLIASGVIARAAEAGESVAVIVMTNGDYDCQHDGLEREGESVKGLAALGVPEDRVFFLGYPDGDLPELGDAPLPPTRRIIDGQCVKGNTTYGKHGSRRTDVHTARHGSPALYTRKNAIHDLAEVLADLRPENVAITHPHDTHPDHATTYAIFREAMDLLPEAPRVHRAIVHNGDCWPTGTEPHEPCLQPPISPTKPMPPLTGHLRGYEPRERLPVPTSCLTDDREHNRKLLAIAAHRSQTRASWESYLFRFAASDEIFFPETFIHGRTGWERSDVSLAPESLTEVHVHPRQKTLFAIAPPLTVHGKIAQGPLALGVLEDVSGGYVLEMDPKRIEARLVRTFGGARDRLVLKVWPLPYDLWSGSPDKTFDLEIEPRKEDGAVAELSLSVQDQLVGEAIDVEPRKRGEWLSLDYPDASGGPSDVAVAIRSISASPSARHEP